MRAIFVAVTGATPSGLAYSLNLRADDSYEVICTGFGGSAENQVFYAILKLRGSKGERP